MRSIRKIKYIRKLAAKIKRRKTIIPIFCLKGRTKQQLFSFLASRKPLKIVGSSLPIYNLPKKVKILISDHKNKDQAAIIPYQEYEEGAILTQVPSQQFLTYKGPLELSIAQMKMLRNDVTLPAYLDDYFSLKSCGREGSTIQAINLWFYKGDRMSTWHYDGHDNFLFMKEGIKEIKLLPPGTKYLQRKSIFNINNNHFKEDKLPSKMSKNCLKCVLKGGQCLFIPRGWWHEVSSFGQPNIAINVWGNSLSKAVSKSEEEAMLRHLILNVSDRLCSGVAAWEELPEDIRQRYRRNLFQIYLNQASKEAS